MDGDDLNPNEEPVNPEAQRILDAFDKLMENIHDPVENGYSIIAEMFNGLVAADLRRIDAALLVAAYIALHDYIEPTEEGKS